MLDHIGVAVSNYAMSKRFYSAALAPLGYAVVMEFGSDAVGLGVGGRTRHSGPGVGAQYYPTYYGAFVLDPDGNNVEAVCHAPA